MLIKKENSEKHENSKDCTVWEYDFPDKNFSLATAYIDGRYPDNGRTLNTECAETYYVISGKGVIHSEKGDFEIEEGDVYYFEKGEIYWTEGEKMFLVLTNAPKWSPDQHKYID